MCLLLLRYTCYINWRLIKCGKKRQSVLNASDCCIRDIKSNVFCESILSDMSMLMLFSFTWNNRSFIIFPLFFTNSSQLYYNCSSINFRKMETKPHANKRHSTDRNQWLHSSIMAFSSSNQFELKEKTIPNHICVLSFLQINSLNYSEAFGMYECEAENQLKVSKAFVIIDGKINSHASQSHQSLWIFRINPIEYNNPKTLSIIIVAAITILRWVGIDLIDIL